MRVMHVAHGQVYGGIETLLRTLAIHRGLCPGMEPEFALCFRGRLGEELLQSGVKVHYLGNTRVSRPQTVFRARRALRSTLRSQQYDIVVCHSAWPQAVLGPVARRAGVSLAFWQHGPTPGRHWLERWARTCEPSVAVSNSTFSARTLGRLYPRTDVEVVYCPVAPPKSQGPAERTAVRRELATTDQDTVIVQVSRLERWKGHREHLNALALLTEVPGWVCWFVGGPQRHEEVSYLKELEAQARTLRLSDRVRFCGQRSDVGRILAAADLFCQPNVGPEPFGITFVEALYAALPVIATAIGGAVEVVDQSCGVLVVPGDTFALSEALARLLADPGARARMGSAGPARARLLCDPAARLSQLEQVLARAIA
jgi:glycosyltransferase involved in cell wall biosynthesis